MKSDFRNDLMEGKVVLITGGATGIGYGIATQFGLHGACVVIGSRRQNVVEEACQKLSAMGIKCSGIPCDVRVSQNCVALANHAKEKFGRLDVLVNNAAGNFMSTAEAITENGFKTVMEIDLHGSFNMAKACLPYLKESGKGVVINITATLHYKANPFQMHAAAAKAGIDVMTETLGVEWGVDYGIRTISIAPGPIQGTVGGPDGRVFGSKKSLEKMKDVRSMVPIGRFGTVEDIANTALFVASDAGSFITATEIVVDGGHWHEASMRYLMGKKMILEKSEHEKQNFKGGVAKL